MRFSRVIRERVTANAKVGTVLGSIAAHCNENTIYVFLFWELRGLSINFHIHVSVSDLYIPRISPHISCRRIKRSIVGIYKSLTGTWMWKLGLWPRNSFSENIYFEFSVLFLCSASSRTVEFEGRQMKQCWINYNKNPKNPLLDIWNMRY